MGCPWEPVGTEFHVMVGTFLGCFPLFLGRAGPTLLDLRQFSTCVAVHVPSPWGAVRGRTRRSLLCAGSAVSPNHGLCAASRSLGLVYLKVFLRTLLKRWSAVPVLRIGEVQRYIFGCQSGLRFCETCGQFQDSAGNVRALALFLTITCAKATS